jgi:hypothetical protein
MDKKIWILEVLERNKPVQKTSLCKYFAQYYAA